MKELMCLECEHVWHDGELVPCPECGSSEVEVSEDQPSWHDGHYEGDF